MIDQRMQEALNKQINAEIYSAYLYLSMSAHFQSVTWLASRTGCVCSGKKS